MENAKSVLQCVEYARWNSRMGMSRPFTVAASMLPPAIRAHSRARELAAGETLFRQGDKAFLEGPRALVLDYKTNVLGESAPEELIALAHERKLPVIEQPLIRLAVAESILHDILGRDLIALLRRNASVRLEIIALDSELALRAVSAGVALRAGGTRVALRALRAHRTHRADVTLRASRSSLNRPSSSKVSPSAVNCASTIAPSAVRTKLPSEWAFESSR